MPASFGLGKPSPEKCNDNAIDSSTPWIAASEGQLPLMQTALSTLNLPASAVDENGYGLVHAAASYNQLNVLQWLLQQQPHIELNLGDNDGDTPLHYAGHVDAAKMLVESGRVDPFRKNAQGKTPLQSKQEELEEMMQDEDNIEVDVEHLRDLVAYLSGLEQVS